MKQKTLALVGVGLMGGSLGLAIRRRKLPYRVLGIGRNLKRLRQAKKMGMCDAVTTHLQEAALADIVVLCTPVHEIGRGLKELLPVLKPGAIVTDMGSIKAQINAQAEEALTQMSAKNPPDFIGSHPMAGSEKTGFENARADLYEQATVVLCPVSNNKKALQELQKFWKAVGAKTVAMPADIHDILVAQTSHLPHVLAGLLSQTVLNAQKTDAHTAQILAGSFRDMTRVADADPELWSQIAVGNQKFLLGALKSYRDRIKQLIQAVETSRNSAQTWQSFFVSAKDARKKLWQKQAQARSHD